MSDDSTPVQLNWIVIIPIILAQFTLICFLVWAIVLAYENFTKNIIYVIVIPMIIAFGTYRLVESKYLHINGKKIDLKKELKSNVKQKIKNEIHSKEFRIGFVIEIVSLLAIFVLIGLQEQFSSDFILDTLNQLASFLIIISLPGYMNYRKLKQNKIKNKFNIIFFCYFFMTIGLVISVITFQMYQESIPSMTLNFSSLIFPDVDLSLLGFYLWILPFKVLLAKYSFRIVVYMAILGSSPGTTTDDDKYPY